MLGKIQEILLSLLKDEVGGYLVIRVKVSGPEYNLTILVNDVAELVRQVASSVDEVVVFVHQLTLGSSQDDVIARVVDVKFSHDVSELKFGNLASSASFLAHGAALFVVATATLGARGRDAVDHSADKVLREQAIQFRLFLHKHNLVGLHDLFTLKPEQLAKIRLRSAIDKLFLSDVHAFSHGRNLSSRRFHISVAVVFVLLVEHGFANLLHFVREDEILDLGRLQASRQRERLTTLHLAATEHLKSTIVRQQRDSVHVLIL